MQNVGQNDFSNQDLVFCFQSLSSIVALTVPSFRYTLYSFSQTQRLWNNSVTRWGQVPV